MLHNRIEESTCSDSFACSSPVWKVRSSNFVLTQGAAPCKYAKRDACSWHIWSPSVSGPACTLGNIAHPKFLVQLCLDQCFCLVCLFFMLCKIAKAAKTASEEANEEAFRKELGQKQKAIDRLMEEEKDIKKANHWHTLVLFCVQLHSEFGFSRRTCNISTLNIQTEGRASSSIQDCPALEKKDVPACHQCSHRHAPPLSSTLGSNQATSKVAISSSIGAPSRTAHFGSCMNTFFKELVRMENSAAIVVFRRTQIGSS